MNFPKPYPSQFGLRGETMTCYGSDFRGTVSYEFNDQGYRSPFNFDESTGNPVLACFGSSIATGHGVELDQCFGALAAQHFGCEFWNLGQGCFRSSNQTVLEQVEYLAQLPIEYYVIQFTHINRQGSRFDSYLEHDAAVNLNNFCSILQKITDLLADKKWCWLLTDWSGAQFPQWVQDHANKIAIDPDIVDHVPTLGYEHLAPTAQALRLLSLHPGPNWHRVTADQIIQFYNNQPTQSNLPDLQAV